MEPPASSLTSSLSSSLSSSLASVNGPSVATPRSTVAAASVGFRSWPQRSWSARRWDQAVREAQKAAHASGEHELRTAARLPVPQRREVGTPAEEAGRAARGFPGAIARLKP